MFSLVITAHLLTTPSPALISDLHDKYSRLPGVQNGQVELCIAEPDASASCEPLRRTKSQPEPTADAGDLAAITLVMKNAKDIAEAGFPVSVHYSNRNPDGTETVLDLNIGTKTN